MEFVRGIGYNGNRGNELSLPPGVLSGPTILYPKEGGGGGYNFEIKSADDKNG